MLTHANVIADATTLLYFKKTAIVDTVRERDPSRIHCFPSGCDDLVPSPCSYAGEID